MRIDSTADFSLKSVSFTLFFPHFYLSLVVVWKKKWKNAATSPAAVRLFVKSVTTLRDRTIISFIVARARARLLFNFECRAPAVILYLLTLHENESS